MFCHLRNHASAPVMPATVGMTLVELLVTMSIIAIAAAIGFPSYRYVTASNHISKSVSDLQSSLELARSHALKTGLPTIVCPAGPNALACSNTADWSDGWMIAVADNGCSTSTVSGQPVQRTNGLSARYKADYEPATTGHTWQCFNRIGVSPTGYHGKFVFNVTEGDDLYKRCVVTSPAGAVQILRAGQTDSVTGETC